MIDIVWQTVPVEPQETEDERLCLTRLVEDSEDTTINAVTSGSAAVKNKVACRSNVVLDACNQVCKDVSIEPRSGGPVVTLFMLIRS